MRLLRRSATNPPVPPNSDEAEWALAETVRDGRRLLLYAREREALLPRLAFVKQEFPLEFDISLQEDADWAVFRRVPGRAGA